MATRLQTYLTPMPSFGGSEWNNRRQWSSMPQTADMRVLDQTYKRSKLAHDALMQAQAMEAEQDNEILATATPDEFANLFGTPRTEREARLQRIVQKDVNARGRGAALIPNEKQALSYAQGLENLKRSRLVNYLEPLKFGLDEARFSETMSQNDRTYMNQLAQRQHAANQLAAQERFRQVQAANAAANLAQRQQAQTANLNQRERFHGDSVSNQQLQQMFEMERMLQDRADEEQRQRNFETRAGRDYFGDVAAAANAGALAPNQMSQFASRFDPATMAILEGYARVGQNSLTTPNSTSQSSSSPGYLSRMADMPFITLPGLGPVPNPFRSSPAAMPTGEPEWPEDYGDDGGEDFGMGSDFAQPPTPAMAARPAPAPAAPQRGQFTPGATIRNRRTGEVFLVLPNGQLQRAR